jgi:hypothetical protein
MLPALSPSEYVVAMCKEVGNGVFQKGSSLQNIRPMSIGVALEGEKRLTNLPRCLPSLEDRTEINRTTLRVLLILSGLVFVIGDGMDGDVGLEFRSIPPGSTTHFSRTPDCISCSSRARAKALFLEVLRSTDNSLCLPCMRLGRLDERWRIFHVKMPISRYLEVFPAIATAEDAISQDSRDFLAVQLVTTPCPRYGWVVVQARRRRVSVQCHPLSVVLG